MMKQSIRHKPFRLFTGIPAGAALASLALAFTLALSACNSPTGPSGEDIDKKELNASITAAGKAKEGVAVSSDNGATVPLGTKWVTNSEMTAFTNAIEAAEDTRDTATSQAAINSAKTALDNAIQTFKDAKKDGTAAPVDTAALTAKIAEAENARTGVQKAASANEVAQGAKWVTADAWNTFDTAITAAKSGLTSANQNVVDQAVTTLAAAITAFANANQNGTKTADFSSADLAALIAQAKAAKDGVTVSTQNGDDISPASSWTSQSDLNSLSTAITSAEAANDGNRDSLYLELVQALIAFADAKKTGAVPDKAALISAIQSADTAKRDVVQAARAGEAPKDSKWATAAQFTPLNTAYDKALDTASKGDATKNAVDAEVSALNAAVSTFNNAVTSNGPGTKTTSITITGLPAADFPNGTEIRLGLNTTASFSNSMPPVYGEAVVNNGQAVVQLTNTSTGAAWTGSGSWYAGFSLEDGRAWISKAAIDFTASANPSIAFSGFKPHVYSYKLGELAPVFSGTESMTLDAFFGTVTGGTYAEYLAEAGEEYKLYKNEALTQAFSGSDSVNANTMVYCASQLGGGNGNGNGEKIGELKGTITFTNVPAQKPQVYISAEGEGSGNGSWWYTRSSQISLSGISGSSGTVNWTLPLYDDDDIPSTTTASFRLEVNYGAAGSYSIYVDGTKPINGPNENVNSIGTVSLASITLSGTINVSFEGSPVPYVYINAYPMQGGGGSSFMQLQTPAANTPWSMVFPAFDSPTDVSLNVSGYNSRNSSTSLFEKQQTVSAVSNTNKTGIAINLGNITPPVAVPLSADAWVDGEFTAANDAGYDLYSIAVTAGQTYYLWTNTANSGDGAKTLGWASVRRISSGGDSVQWLNAGWSYPGTFTADSNGTVTIKVQPDGGGSNTGTYAIVYSTSNSKPGSGGGGFPPSLFTTLTANTWTSGNITSSGGEQWFKFTATAATQYIHVVFGTLNYMWVQVYDSTGTAVGSATDFYSSTRSTSRTVTSGQVYYIKVTPASTSYSGTYHIAFHTSNTPPLFEPSSFTELSAADAWTSGNIATAYGEQWFKFTATAATQYIHAAFGTLTNLYVYLYDSTGTPVGSGTSLYNSNRYTSETVTNGAVYYIRVTSSNTGDYQIGFTTSIAPPGATALTADAWASGNIATAYGEQWFKFTATASTQYIHAAFGTLTDLYVYLYDSTSTLVGSRTELYGSTSYTSKTVTNGAVYYIMVMPYNNDSGAYQIGFTTSETAPGGGS